jgi:hypothetical protein
MPREGIPYDQMPMHPIPVGGKAMHKPHSSTDEARRFTVRSVRQLSHDSSDNRQWEYTVTFDADPTNTEKLIQTGPNDGITDISHADPEKMYNYLTSDVHPYCVGDKVKYINFESLDTDCESWNIGTIVKVKKVSFDENRDYHYTVTVEGTEGKKDTIFNTEECLCPVNYHFKRQPWAEGKTIWHNKTYGKLIGFKDVPTVQEVPFYYYVDVSLCLFFLCFCMFLFFYSH